MGTSSAMPKIQWDSYTHCPYPIWLFLVVLCVLFFSSYYFLSYISYLFFRFVCHGYLVFLLYFSMNYRDFSVGWLVVLLFYVHGKHLRSCRDGQLT